MIRTHLTLALTLCLTGILRADLSGPEAEAVYGGRVWGMDWIETGADSSRIFLSTESANTLFFADVDHSGTSPGWGAFQSMPDADADDGFGSNVRLIAADEASGWLFFGSDSGLYRLTESAGSLVQEATGFVQALTIKNGWLYYLNAGQIYFGQIDPASGAWNESGYSPVSHGAGMSPDPRLEVGTFGGSERLFLFVAGNADPLWLSSDVYDAFDASTSFSPLVTSGLTDPAAVSAFGSGPDGRLFLGGVIGVEPAHEKSVAWLDFGDASWTEFSTGVGGTSGSWLHCSQSLPVYSVYYGTAFSDSLGESGSWQLIGNSGQETHPNDAGVLSSPLDAHLLICTSDQGIAASVDGGDTIFEIDEGLEAVQVKDIEMDSDKNIAWVASKSGIRRVTDYQTSPVWTNSIFPGGDGSPYYSIAMDTSDHSGDTVYAGNARVYKSSDGGGSWIQTLDAQQAPWNLDFFSWVSTLEVDPWNSNRVAAAYYARDEDDKGQLFLSEDGGLSFDMISGGALPSDGADFNDLIFLEEAGVSVLYAGVDYTYTLGYGTSYAVYRIEGDHTSGWSVTQDMSFAVSIKDLAVDSSGGLWAVGSDVGGHPNTYYKAYGSGSWVAVGSSGLPSNGAATAVAVGDDGLGHEIPHLAVNGGVYYLSHGSSAWTPGHQYPAGMEVNALYYDDLLVATGTGLYAQNTYTSAHEPEFLLCGQDCGFNDMDNLYQDPPAIVVDDIDGDLLSVRWFINDSLVCEDIVSPGADCITMCTEPLVGIPWETLVYFELTDGTWTVNPGGINCSWFGEVTVEEGVRPGRFELYPPAPNPFNPSTLIAFDNPRAGKIRIAVYNLQGALIEELLDERMDAGRHEIQWMADRHPSGMYLLRVLHDGGAETRKLTLLK